MHVAGTNGKGSIASTLTSILTAGGYTTGLYTSPHLVRFNERIRINGCSITDERVMAAYRAVKDAHTGDRQPTFFEFTTAMALNEFGRQAVDWAVVETGMGGRLDATNMITPALSIITNISIEHREYLGNTIAQIAAEKAGIIKSGVPVVTAVRQKSAVGVIESVAADRAAPVFRKGAAFRTRRNRDGSFNYYGMDHTWRGLRPPLLGDHQVENAAMVLAGCEVLIRSGVDLSLEDIRTGFANTRWPGRLEVVKRSPLVILDGAHNLEAARRLAAYLASQAAGRKITLVVGILALLLASAFDTVLDLILHAYAFMVSGLLVPTLGAYFWKRSRSEGALTSMAGGGGLTLYLTFTETSLPWGLDPSLFGIALSLVLFVGVSLACGRKADHA